MFFRRHSLKEGLLCSNVWDVGLDLGSPVTWAWRTAQVEVTINTMQEGCQAIMDAVMEKKMQARGPGYPQVLQGAT